MPRRKARPRARRKMDGLTLLNLATALAVGPYSEDGARAMARQWADPEVRGAIEKAGLDGEPHWPRAVLDRGEDPPWEPDPRLDENDEEHARFEEDRRAEEQRLAEIARSEYRKTRGADA